MAGIEEELTLGPEQGELSLPALGKLHDWVITVDHKRLGIMYIAGGSSSSGRWTASSTIRLQLIMPNAASFRRKSSIAANDAMAQR